MMSHGVDANGLPTRCPDWCTNPHVEALIEGCSVEEASVHYNHDRACNVARVPGEAETGWRAWLTSATTYRAQAHIQVHQIGGAYVEMKLTPEEMLALGRTLQVMAESALFETSVPRGDLR